MRSLFRGPTSLAYPGERLAFWLTLLFAFPAAGLIGFFIVLTSAGLIQGQDWNNGETVYRTLAEMPTYMGLRAAFGMSIIAAAVVGLYNFCMTVWRGEPFTPEYVVEPEEDL